MINFVYNALIKAAAYYVFIISGISTIGTLSNFRNSKCKEKGHARSKCIKDGTQCLIFWVLSLPIISLIRYTNILAIRVMLTIALILLSEPFRGAFYIYIELIADPIVSLSVSQKIGKIKSKALRWYYNYCHS